MSDLDHGTQASREVGLIRLGVGLAVGLALFGLSEAAMRHVWPATDRPIFIALVIMALSTGPVVLSGLGSLKRTALIVWTVIAMLVTAAIGWVEGYRGLTGFETVPSPLVMAAVLAGSFIAHSLIVAAARDGRRIAGYATYFDVAWKHGVQLALAGVFAGIFWGILALGAALFDIIGVKLFSQIISERWFAIPASALAFAAAVHLTDVRLGLIQGVRTVALTLLGWLLPLLAGLTLAFLAALPFTGLKPLWNTGNAAMILIGAGASLILLINAAYQDGGREKPLPAALRWSMRLAGLLLVPLTVLAAQALLLRIGQYGLTIERVIAVASVVVGACYALGYALAAVLPGPVMRRLEPTNVATSFIGLAVLLALLSPLADPVRLSVDNQVARLQAGKVKPADFDFKYLKFSAGRSGERAFAKLKTAGGETGRLALEADKLRSRWDDSRPSKDQQTLDSIKVYPAGKILPDTLKARWSDISAGKCVKGLDPCEIALIDLDGDGQDEALVLADHGEIGVFAFDTTSGWTRQGEIERTNCANPDQLWATIRSGKAGLKPGRWRDLDVDGVILSVKTDIPSCPATSPASAKPPVK